MTEKPKMYREHEKRLVHCEAANGQDYTLCGFTLDGDQGPIDEVSDSKINCPDCIGIINFCRSLPLRASVIDARYRRLHMDDVGEVKP